MLFVVKNIILLNGYKAFIIYTNIIKMIQGVIFDFDNTLYNYDLCNTRALEKVFDNLTNFVQDKDVIVKEYQKLNSGIKNSNTYSNKFNKSIYFKKLFENLDIDIVQLDITLKIYEQEFILNLKLFDGVKELLDLLVKNKIKIFLASNNVFSQQYLKLKELNILKFFNKIITSDEIGNEKPDEQFYINLIYKTGLNPENIIMIGDNYEHDILPAISYGLIPFYFTFDNSKVIIKDRYFQFGCFFNLKNYLSDYFKSEDDYLFLSKYFGQSVLTVQGQGGNISIKNNDCMLIKSSGCILANTDLNNGFCVVDKSKYIEQLKSNTDTSKLNKLFGYKVPSMETYFHSYMKKYTVHIHFTLSNIFLSSEHTKSFDDLTIPHKIINYYPPGIILSKQIFLKYTKDCNLYFLKNHGLILTGETVVDVIKLFENLYLYFDTKLNHKYSSDYFTWKINKKIYKKFNKTVVCRQYNNIPIECITNIKYCFPDLAVYIHKICQLNNLNQIYDLEFIPEIILYNSNIYLISENLTKLYCLIETLDLYKDLCKHNYESLKIIDESLIQNMEQEKYRKNN